MKPARQVWPVEFAIRYREAGYWRGVTMDDFLRERVAASPDHLAVVDERVRWTYEELDGHVDAIAGGFQDRGLEPGERVLVHLPNRAEFLSVAFGLFRAGLVPVFALPAHRASEITHFAAAAEASAYVIADRHEDFDYRPLAEQLQREVPGVREVVVVGESGPFTPLTEIEQAGSARAVRVDSSDVALMQLSGGSTGLSKLIPRTHDDYIYSFRESAAICGLSPSSVYLGALPIAHNFPMSSPGVFGALHAGSTVALSGTPHPEVAFGVIERERVTITGLVPPLALVWMQAAASTTHDISSLEVVQIGGARLAPEIARRVEPALGARLQQVFGMAEGLVNYTRLDDPDEVIINTQGRPISADDELLIVDDDGAPVEDGTPGHLLTRGPYTIRAYHDAPEHDALAFTPDGYYRTGDIVIRRGDGYLVVHGRATDQINRGGEKVSPDEVEEELLAHPRVHDVALVSVEDPYLGERSCAFVVPLGERPTVAELKRWVRERGLAAYKVPDQIVFVDAFPETGVGKTNRKGLRAAIRDQLVRREEPRSHRTDAR